ncbi:hypothetical protein KF840_13710 [bacterium]|nr:hypothetical protein [bacterium]
MTTDSLRPGARRAPASPLWRGGAALLVGGVVTALAAVVAVVAWQVREGQRLPDAPVAIAWDREACAHCHMQLSQPQYAVQLQTLDGEVVNFDDPGCFFLYLDDERPAIREVWFHDSRSDHWWRRHEVAFVAAPATPMNLGLAAVADGEPGAISYDEARARIAARPEVRR